MTDDDRIAALLEAAGLAGAQAAGRAIGGGTSACVRRIDRDGRPLAVAKLAAPHLPPRRAAAEAHVLGVIGPRAGLPVPPLLARVGDDLLVGWCGGDASPADLAAVLAAIARVHAAPLDAEDAGRLAAWGRGTDGAADPFARRSRRVARRADGFIALLPPERRAAWARWIAHVTGRFEAACHRTAGLPAGLLHGDLHPGHAIAGPGGVRLVDWQHASIGPAAVDVVRVLVEHEAPVHAAAAVAAAAADRLGDDIGREAIDDVLALTIGGLVAGFGGRPPDRLAAWERRIVDRATDPAGWAAGRLARMGGGTG